jgi:hypothetical protein
MINKCYLHFNHPRNGATHPVYIANPSQCTDEEIREESKMNLYNLSLTNPTAAREIYDGLNAQEREDLCEELGELYYELITIITYND